MRYLVGLAVLLCLGVAKAEDTILLNDGSKVEGTIAEEHNDTVVVKLKFGTTTYRKKEIKEIVRKGAGAANAADVADLRDVLILKNGQEQRGLIVSEDKTQVVFDMVVSGRNVSKTMLSQTSFQHAEISEIKRITDVQREAVRKYLASANEQARREAAAEQNVAVETAIWKTKDGKDVSVRKIALEFFTIESDAPEDFLKRAAVKLGKVFNAYKQYFGADRNQGSRVTVKIYNSMASYYASIDNAVKNPAFYAPQLKMICAGCEVDGYERAIAEVRGAHGQLDAQLQQARRQVADARAQVQAQVSKAYSQANAGGKGVSAEDQAVLEQIKAQQREFQLEIGQFEKQIVEIQSQIASLNRRNDVLFAEYTKQMFAVLYHEGFHAFLDNFLFDPKQAEKVPRWLNEGLAQYFELSRLENDRLILGQEDRERMAFLRQFKKDNGWIALEKLVEGDAKDYLVHDVSNLQNSTKNYMQSWLLVNWLGENKRLTKETLHQYVKELGGGKTPQQALEVLSGVPNAQLEAALLEKLKVSINAEPVK